MQRELFIKRPLPYYIQAPNYRRSSSGIRVMHMLCDALNRSGQEAYIVADVLNPQLMTPKLTPDVVELHRSQGLQPIAIYPEIIDGNPLNASTVVRYILNQPGFVEGRGKYEDDDILFSYTKPLLLPGMAENRVLYLPAPDLKVFCPPTDPAKRVPGKVCYYQGRRGQAKVDPALLPADAVEITAQWPATWEELADLFQRCEFFYCTEASALGGEAALCGCLAVILPNEWAPLKLEPTAYGVAWSLEPEEIERAKSTNHLLRDRLLKAQVDFWPALDHFIEVTQVAAQERAATASKSTLQAWLADRLPTAAENCLIGEYLQQHQGGPSIGVVVLDTEGQSEALMVTLKSLLGEHCLYATLRILVITPSEVPATSAADKLHFLPMTDEPLAVQINRVVEASDCQWFMLARAGDEFTQSGLMVTALELAGNPDCRAVYGDQLQRLPDGNLGAAFLPGFNLDLLLSFPLVMARYWLYRRDLFINCGGFDAEYPEAFEFELLTRLIEQEGLVGLGHIDEPLLITAAPTLRDNADERRVIERHLRNRGYQAQVLPGLPARYRVHYGHAATPLVSIILSTDVPLPELQRCIDSLLEKTAYAHYELLLADTGARADVSAWLREVAALGDDKVRVLAASSALAQNHAAEQARGEYLLLLSGAAAIVNADWLDELLNHAQRPEVGVVGGKLLTPNGRIAQAGLVLGLNGPATPAFMGEPMDAAGYLQRLQVDQNYSAVGEACLMVRAELFRQLGGLDAGLAGFRDVDLCLKAREAGYLTVWAAHAAVLHETQSWQVEAAVEDQLYERYLPQLANDPAYNRNLALSGQGFDLESDVSLTWRPLSWRPLPVILAHPADPWGCGHYRVIQPFSAMKSEGLADGMMSMGLLRVTDLARFEPDVVVLQRQIGDERLEAMRRIHKFSRAFTVYELDDYLPNLPMKSVHRSQMPKDILKSLRRGLGFVDRFVVSTAPLAEAFAGLHGDIRVVKNRLPLKWWQGLHAERRQGGKPRVGWAGGASHTGDLELIADVVKELAGEVEWVFFGMCPDSIRPYVHEVHVGVEIDSYPAALARLNLDLAIAPVEQNLFNECKSNLRLLEYGACGFPVVCSDLECYKGDLPVTRVKNRFRDWVEAIRMHINDLDATAEAGDRLRAAVHRDWMLEGAGLQRWRDAWMPD